MVRRTSFVYVTWWFSFVLLLIYCCCCLSLIDVFQTDAYKKGNNIFTRNLLCVCDVHCMIRCITKPYDLGVSYYDIVHLVYIWLEVIVSGHGRSGSRKYATCFEKTDVLFSYMSYSWRLFNNNAKNKVTSTAPKSL